MGENLKISEWSNLNLNFCSFEKMDCYGMELIEGFQGSIDYLERSLPMRKQASMLELDDATSLEAQLSMILTKLNVLDAKLEEELVNQCEWCQGNHFTDQCHLVDEPVNFVQNFDNELAFGQPWNQQGEAQWLDQNQNLQSTWQELEYAQNWNQNVDSSAHAMRRNSSGFGHLGPVQQLEQELSFEETLLKKMDMLLSNNQRYDQFFEDQHKRNNLLETNLKKLETQIGQLAQEFHRRQAEGLSSDIDPNTKGKEQCCTVTLRCGKELYNEAAEAYEKKRKEAESEQDQNVKGKNQVEIDQGQAETSLNLKDQTETSKEMEKRDEQEAETARNENSERDKEQQDEFDEFDWEICEELAEMVEDLYMDSEEEIAKRVEQEAAEMNGYELKQASTTEFKEKLKSSIEETPQLELKLLLQFLIATKSINAKRMSMDYRKLHKEASPTWKMKILPTKK